MRFTAAAVACSVVGLGLAAQTPKASFEDFLAGLRTEAAAKGISQATIDAALANVEQLPVAVERDRTQPEMVVSLDTYVSRQLTKKVLTRARSVADDNTALLKRVEARYGVPAEVIVAVWGVESNFGAFTGTRATVPALATLAYDGRRALFRNELFDALRFVDAGHITVDQLKGSWAGAMGQPQFMPSSYLKYAVDFDDDGKADIWTNTADVFGSIGNYLKEFGWTNDTRWGREVKLTRAARTKIDHSVPMRTGTCRAERDMTAARTLADWAKLGVTLPNGSKLPKADLKASLVRGDKRAFLVYANYDAILGYNCSNSYAVTVGLLADSVSR